MRRQRMVTVAAVAAVVALVVGIVTVAVVARSGTSAALPATVTEPGGPIVYGQASPVVVDVWEDFQCGACAQFEADGGKALADLAAAGEIQVRYHMMSFIGAGSAPAAAAAACAADVSPEAFASVHEVFFANSADLASADLVALAASAGVDDPEFVACVNSDKYRGWVNDSQNAAARAGVPGTPLVKINGTEVQVRTFDEIVRLVEQASGSASGTQ